MFTSMKYLFIYPVILQLMNAEREITGEESQNCFFLVEKGKVIRRKGRCQKSSRLKIKVINVHNM